MRKRGSWNKSKNEIINAGRASADVQAEGKWKESPPYVWCRKVYFQTFRLQYWALFSGI